LCTTEKLFSMTTHTRQYRQVANDKRCFSLNKKRESRLFRPLTFWYTYTVLLLLQLNVRTANSFSASFGLGAIFAQPKGLITTSAKGDIPSLLEASDFFVDAFWVAKVGGGATELSEKQRKILSASQFSEFRSRYAGSGRGQSELVTCRLPTGELTGCAGIEVTPIPDKGLKGLNTKNGPLMSNLAVGRAFRRKGIAEKLVNEVERMVQYEWGYDDCYLYVEERNKPAVRLYQKLGYKKMWVDKEATTLLPSSNGKLKTSATKIVCMRKRLDLGLIGRLLPF